MCNAELKEIILHLNQSGKEDNSALPYCEVPSRLGIRTHDIDEDWQYLVLQSLGRADRVLTHCKLGLDCETETRWEGHMCSS